ncbi:MAG: hypothetical protein R3A80_10680 [Bdellovibrionota bacterium]
MPKSVISKSLLNLLPQHRIKEKRTLQLTLDELIDDYRKLHELSASELDFLLMAYRFEHIFQKFLKEFLQKPLKPEELTDLWRMAFASLLTRNEDSIAQLTHAWVEASKEFFGPFTASLSNAFLRKALREKSRILLEAQPQDIIGPSLSQRWHTQPELQKRFAARIIRRPDPGIACLDKNSVWQLVDSKTFRAGTHLAISKASALWTAEIIARIKSLDSIKLLDACAAPGGKLIATLNAVPKIEKALAVDAKFKRIERLKDNLALWGHGDKAQTILHDWSDQHPSIETDFNVVIADLPCTGLGTLASRPDLLIKDWRQDDKNLFRIQERILTNATQCLTKNGLIFASICSSDPSEVQHINKILNSTPSFHSKLSEDNSEEITGWVIIKE